MKKFIAIIPLILFLYSCNTGGDTEGKEFFAKLNSQKITSHELKSDILESEIASGEIIYVPVYSSIYFRDDTKVYNLTVTLSIRNIDPINEIFIREINYNNSKGENVKKFLKMPVRVKPLETLDLVIAEDDTTGGIGANFIVQWISKTNAISPIVEAVMISIRQGVGLSFTENGRVIKKIK
ncbi:MAG: hypothetical protein BWY23_01075 [Spirochaetes bacterium ADurb.Bin218]|jgi:5,10-methenyltetrahydromethanopterin hydrogenase|nr:DUF3124 domain-containing protein [Spirochaetota bacterium]OQA98456.1 MAG: hypothetical protein BWY23_01075 [Spirochaetes bacterium ADurb.Bin218]HOV08484.1 DUF3124 domain-containing protein [Spirochaetota bacterium]HPX91382.1 DUF3124 domain-containing protein [Spirochaetota bacterium]